MQANNMAAMREALSEIVLLTVKAGKSISCDVACGIIASKAKHALKQPPRNCDMGTADEQYSRMFRKCYEWMCRDCKSSDKDFRKCALSWAQLPYEEGG